jgi:hypothetical protein
MMVLRSCFGLVVLGFWTLEGTLSVCMVIPEGQVFRADFSQSSGVECCFLAGSSSEFGSGIGSWVT